MANRRMINSDLFSDDVFMELNDITRLTWIGLIVMSADDQGRLQDNEMLIKSQIFPMDNKTPAKIKNALDTLEQNEMIHRYQKDGKNLIQIVNWWKHQSPAWASASNYPAPDNWVDREKYHTAGNEITATNWDKQGGFSELHSGLHSELHSGLHSELHSEQVTPLVVNESTIKSTIKSTSDVKNENTYENTREIETPEGGTSTYSGNSDKLKSILSHYKAKTGKLDTKDAAMLKDLSVAYSIPDIRAAIDHMISHTDRPNGSYLRKILEGWYNEKNIHKVYK